MIAVPVAEQDRLGFEIDKILDHEWCATGLYFQARGEKSSRMTRPFTAAANVAFVSHENSTLSRVTAPVLSSTFSLPKNFWRAATNSARPSVRPLQLCATGVNEAAHRPPSTKPKQLLSCSSLFLRKIRVTADLGAFATHH